MRRVAIAGLVTVVALIGCSVRPAAGPAPAPVGALPSADAIFAALAARRSAVHSLRAWARLSYASPEESRRVKQLLVAERPDRLRMELFSPFGAVFVLATADGALAAYARDEATVYRGAASPANLERYTQVDLPVDTAVDLLLGTPPLDEAAGGVVSADDGAVKLWQEGRGGTVATWFTTALEPVRYERHAVDGRVLLRTSFADYAPVDGLRIPMQLGIELPPSQRRIDIALSEPEVNPLLPEAVFALQTPAGSREVDLDRDPNP
jgi:hypothetical protein